MNLERVVERLRDYRLKNERFDRLVGAVLSNEKAMGAARATVAAARSVSRRVRPSPQGIMMRCSSWQERCVRGPPGCGTA